MPLLFFDVFLSLYIWASCIVMFSKIHEQSGGVELVSKRPGSKRHSYIRPENFFLACLITLLFVSIGSLSQAQDVNPAYKQLRTIVPVDLSPSRPTSLPGTSGPQFGGGWKRFQSQAHWSVIGCL